MYSTTQGRVERYFLRTKLCEGKILNCNKHNVHRFIVNWAFSLDDNKSVDIVYIDISKAFDYVVANKLIYKLKNLGFENDILTWIDRFLANCWQCVTLNGVNSVYSSTRKCFGPSPLSFVYTRPPHLS